MSDFKFIHVSDIHLGREITKKYSFLDSLQETRVRRSPLTVLDKLAMLAEEEEIDFLLIA
jgi:DNA repair exonuclease SbcCD nuclease subunit